MWFEKSNRSDVVRRNWKIKCAARFECALYRAPSSYRIDVYHCPAFAIVFLFRAINLFHLNRSVVYLSWSYFVSFIFFPAVVNSPLPTELRKDYLGRRRSPWFSTYLFPFGRNRPTAKAFKHRISFAGTFLCNSRYPFVMSVDGVDTTCTSPHTLQ